MSWDEERMEAQSNLCDDCEEVIQIDDLDDDALIDELESRNYNVTLLRSMKAQKERTNG